MSFAPTPNLKLFGACALAIAAAACSTAAPPQLISDRLDFNRAVSDSWKEQALLITLPTG